MKPFKRTPVARITAALASLLVIGLALVFLSGIANAWEPGSSDRRIPRPPSPDAGWWVVQSALQENRCNQLGCYAIPGTPLMLNHATSQGDWVRAHGVGDDQAPGSDYGVYGPGFRPQCPRLPNIYAAGQWYLNRFIQFNWDSGAWEIQSTLNVFWAEDPCLREGNTPTPVPTLPPIPTPRPTEQRSCDTWTPPSVQPDFAWRPRDPLVHLPTEFFVSDLAEIYLDNHQARYRLAGYWFDYGDGETGTGSHIYRQSSVFSTLYDSRGNPSYPVVLHSTYEVTYRRTCRIETWQTWSEYSCNTDPLNTWRGDCGGEAPPNGPNNAHTWQESGWREVARYQEDEIVIIPGVPRLHPVPVFQAKGEQW